MSASCQPSNVAFLSSGILGNLKRPNDLATPIKSRFCFRKMYDASCFEYAWTNETSALTDYKGIKSITEFLVTRELSDDTNLLCRASLCPYELRFVIYLLKLLLLGLLRLLLSLNSHPAVIYFVLWAESFEWIRNLVTASEPNCWNGVNMERASYQHIPPRFPLIRPMLYHPSQP